MKYSFSSWTSRFVVIVFSRNEVRRIDCVRVEAERVLRTRGWPSCCRCSLSCNSLSLMSGSSQMSNGVSPFRVLALMLAPFCASISTTSRWPQQAAAWIGCHWSASTTSVETWWSSRNSTTDRYPLAEAERNNVTLLTRSLIRGREERSRTYVKGRGSCGIAELEITPGRLEDGEVWEHFPFRRRSRVVN